MFFNHRKKDKSEEREIASNTANYIFTNRIICRKPLAFVTDTV